MLSYCQQEFSFPDSVIYQIVKNPSTPKCYQKLIKTCKYFFAKNPILIVHCLFFREHWSSCFECNDFTNKIELKPFNFEKSVSKIWITRQLSIAPFSAAEKNIASSFSERIHRFNNAPISYTVQLENQIMTFNELLNYSSFRTLKIRNINVTLKKGSKASMEIILNAFKNVKIFVFKFTGEECSPKTVENLLKIPHFSNLVSFNLENISDSFDINKFYGFLKNNKTIGVCLKFNDTVSIEYCNRLNEIVDEIIQISPDSKEYIPMALGFPQQNNEKIQILAKNLFQWYKKQSH